MGKKKNYLEKIGLKSNDTCSFNTTEKDKKRQKKFDEERKIYGFDSRETWSLYYTSAEWLYCHLKMFLEKGGKADNLNWGSFNIPVLVEIKDGKIIASTGRNYETETRNMSLLEAINLCTEYLEFFLVHRHETAFNNFRKAYENAECAFKIYAEIFSAMWW